MDKFKTSEGVFLVAGTMPVRGTVKLGYFVVGDMNGKRRGLLPQAWKRLMKGSDILDCAEHHWSKELKDIMLPPWEA